MKRLDKITQKDADGWFSSMKWVTICRWNGQTEQTVEVATNDLERQYILLNKINELVDAVNKLESHERKDK